MQIWAKMFPRACPGSPADAGGQADWELYVQRRGEQTSVCLKGPEGHGGRGHFVKGGGPYASKVGFYAYGQEEDLGGGSSMEETRMAAVAQPGFWGLAPVWEELETVQRSWSPNQKPGAAAGAVGPQIWLAVLGISLQGR